VAVAMMLRVCVLLLEWAPQRWTGRLCAPLGPSVLPVTWWGGGGMW